MSGAFSGTLRPARLLRPGAAPGHGPPLPIALLGLVVGVLVCLPIAYLVIRALAVDPGSLDLVLRPRTAEVLLGSLALAAIVAAADVLIGLPLAWLTTRTDLPGRRAWAVLTIAPLAVPSYVMAFALVAALGPRGALQDLLLPLGVERLPSLYGLPGAVIVLTLATYPYVVLTARVALLRADPVLEEAGRSLGDDARTAFRRLALPLLLPAIAAGVLLAVLYALSDFGAVSILRFDSFARQIYVQYRASLDRHLAALLALVLVALTLAVAWAEARLRGRAEAVHHPPRRPTRPVPLGRWRRPALIFCSAIVSLALVMPAAVICFWLARGLASGEPLRLLGDAALRSLGAGASAALVACLLALPVGLLVVRYRGRIATFVERAIYGAYALPGIAVALSLVFLASNLAPFLYQTFLLLVLAYVLRFLAQALAPVRAALQRVGPRPEEAARTLGRGPLRAFLEVTLPLLRPGLVGGATLVFLTVVKELPLTLLLAPIGFDTLATAVWGAVGEGFYARAAAPAGFLMLLSAASVALLSQAEAQTA